MQHKRLISLLTVLVFSAGNFSAYAAVPAALETPSPESGLSFPAHLNEIQFPQALGRIEDSFEGKNNQLVIVVQDAHAIPEAQRSIQNIIQHFQEKYGLDLIGLEGASSQLDSRIFRSFPDKEILKNVFQNYYDKGELTGSVAAAIFSEKPAVFHGVENWALYEKGLELYLSAMKKQPELLEKVEGRRRKVEERKKQVYSQELLEVDQKLQAFYQNHTDLTETLKWLAQYKKPAAGSELAVMLDEVKKNGENNVSIEIEVKQLAEMFRLSLRGGAADEAISRSFNQKNQDFQTSRISAQEFALWMKETSDSFCHPERSEGSQNTDSSLCELRMTKELDKAISKQKRLRDIEGTKFFDDFEKYAYGVKKSLFKSPEDEKLSKETKRLEILRKLIQLELSRDEWENLKKLQVQSWKLEGTEAQFAFYQNAEQRDAAFFENLMRLTSNFSATMKADPSFGGKHPTSDSLLVAGGRHQNLGGQPASLLVAGGFHARGLTERLKAAGFSYLLILPQIGSIPEETSYKDQMLGNVSWKDYFEVENGRVSLYKAFVRGTRDRLLGRQETRDKGQGNSLVSRPLSRAPLLKYWRDQIIRDLSSERQIERSGEYTKFIDELQFEVGSLKFGEKLFKLQTSNLQLKEAMAKIERFIDGLKNLKLTGQLTEQNIVNLAKPSAAQTQAGGVLSILDSLPEQIAKPVLDDPNKVNVAMAKSFPAPRPMRPAAEGAARLEVRSEQFLSEDFVHSNLTEGMNRRSFLKGASALGLVLPILGKSTAQEVAAVTLDEAGYKRIAATGDVSKMAEFIKRYLDSIDRELNPSIPQIATKALLHFASFFTAKVNAVQNPESGKGVQTFAQMKKELEDYYEYSIRRKGVETSVASQMLESSRPIVSQAGLDEAGYQKVAATGDVLAVAGYVKKIAVSLQLEVTDRDHLLWFSRWYTAKNDKSRNPLFGKMAQNYENLIRELKLYGEKGEWLRRQNSQDGGISRVNGLINELLQDAQLPQELLDSMLTLLALPKVFDLTNARQTLAVHFQAGEPAALRISSRLLELLDKFPASTPYIHSLLSKEAGVIYVHHQNPNLERTRMESVERIGQIARSFPRGTRVIFLPEAERKKQGQEKGGLTITENSNFYQLMEHYLGSVIQNEYLSQEFTLRYWTSKDLFGKLPQVRQLMAASLKDPALRGYAENTIFYLAGLNGKDEYFKKAQLVGAFSVSTEDMTIQAVRIMETALDAERIKRGVPLLQGALPFGQPQTREFMNFLMSPAIYNPRLDDLPKVSSRQEMRTDEAGVSGRNREAAKRSEARVAEFVPTLSAAQSQSDEQIIAAAKKMGIRKSFVLHDQRASFDKPLFHVLLSAVLSVFLSTHLIFAFYLNYSSSLAVIIAYLLYTVLNFNFIEGVLTDLALLKPLPLLPEMDFRQGIPANQRTVVFFPILFRSEKELRFIEENLLSSMKNNLDDNVVWVVNSGSGDEMSQIEAQRFEALAKEYPGKLYYFYRSSHLNNWEKKRGGYMHFMKWLVGGNDPKGTIPRDEDFPAMPHGEIFDRMIGDVSAMGSIKNFLIGDSDTIWPTGSVRKMVSKIAAPENARFTIFQGTLTLHNAHSSVLTASQYFIHLLLRTQIGARWRFFGRVNFFGHGAGWNIQKFLNGIAGQMVDGYSSHDIPEGYFLETALVGEVETSEEEPATVENLIQQWSRWWRGNRIFSLRLLGPYRPNEKGESVRNAGKLVEKALILDADRNYIMAPVLIAFISFLAIGNLTGLLVFNLSIFASLGPVILGLVLLRFYLPYILKMRNATLTAKALFVMAFQTVLGATLLVELTKMVFKDAASLMKRKQENQWIVQGSLESRTSFKPILQQTWRIAVGAALLAGLYLIFFTRPSFMLLFMLGSLMLSPLIVWYAAQPPPSWLVSPTPMYQKKSFQFTLWSFLLVVAFVGFSTHVIPRWYVYHQLSGQAYVEATRNAQALKAGYFRDLLFNTIHHALDTEDPDLPPYITLSLIEDMQSSESILPVVRYLENPKNSERREAILTLSSLIQNPSIDLSDQQAKAINAMLPKLLDDERHHDQALIFAARVLERAKKKMEEGANSASPLESTLRPEARSPHIAARSEARQLWSRRNFLKTIGAGVGAVVLSQIPGDQVVKQAPPIEPLPISQPAEVIPFTWQTYPLENNAESVRAFVLWTLDWFISKKYPNKEVLKRYRHAFVNATPNTSGGVLFGKLEDSDFEQIEIVFGVDNAYQMFQMARSIQSPDLFFEAASILPREAWGYEIYRRNLEDRKKVYGKSIEIEERRIQQFRDAVSITDARFLQFLSSDSVRSNLVDVISFKTAFETICRGPRE